MASMAAAAVPAVSDSTFPFEIPAKCRHLAVIGDSFIDIEAYVGSELPGWGGDCRAKGAIIPRAGGSALNTATHLRALSPKPEIETVTLHSVLGDDPWADVLRKHCDTRGVDMQATTLKDAGTGTCIVLSGPDDRSFVTHYGAVALMDAEKHISFDTTGTHASDPKLPSVLHLAGYFSTVRMQEQLPNLIRDLKLRKPEMLVSLDTNYDAAEMWGRDSSGADGGVKSQGHLLELLKLVDIFMPNEDEAKGISGTSTVEDALESLSESVKLVIVTRGSAGASIRHGDVRFDVSSPVPSHVASTVGAGDAFKAAFLAAMVRGMPLIDCVQYACCAGSAAVQYLGACDVQLKHEDIAASMSAHVEHCGVEGK